MKVRPVLACLLVVGLVAACAKATPTPTPAPGATATPTPTPRVGPTTPTPPPPPTALKPTGELRIATGYLGVEVMDPSLGPASGSKISLEFLYDFLVGGTLDAQFSKETGIARDWEVTHGAKSSTYTFTLRQGVKFHNGDEVTAEDVKFSLEYFMRPTSVATSAGLLRAQIDHIEAPEKYKVVVHTKRPYPFLLIDLGRVGYAEGMVLPKKYIQEKGEENFNRSPVGTGPYRFKEQVVGSYMRFEAVDQHWLYGVPKYKTVTMFLVPEETTRIAMLKTGQADVADVSRERVKELGGLKTYLKAGSSVVTMWLGNTWQADTYLGDKRVREALNLAINREDILKFIFEGQGVITGNGHYGTWALGYKALPLYPHDPERAKSLLKEAFPGGVSLTIDSYNRPGVSELTRMNEAVAGFWDKVGVKTKIVPMEYGTHRTKQSKGEIPNIAAGFATENRSVWNALYRVLSHSKGLLTLTKDPKLDELIELSEGELDINKLGERQWQVPAYIRENHLTMPMIETGLLYAANPNKVTRWELGKLIFDVNFLDLITRP